MARNSKVEPSLYQRLGGYDVIASVVDQVLTRMREDPKFARFATRSSDSRNRARQLLVDQMCGLAGGPCVYVGRDMKSSHAGLGITGDEWEASLRHTRDALEQQGIGEPEQREFLELFERYRADIVEAQASPVHRAGAE
jgi:hemoglobin